MGFETYGSPCPVCGEPMDRPALSTLYGEGLPSCGHSTHLRFNCARRCTNTGIEVCPDEFRRAGSELARLREAAQDLLDVMAGKYTHADPAKAIERLAAILEEN